MHVVDYDVHLMAGRSAFSQPTQFDTKPSTIGRREASSVSVETACRDDVERLLSRVLGVPFQNCAQRFQNAV